MKELIIDQTAKSPQIDLNHLTGNLIFSGKSIPENAAKAYEPVLNWVTEYISNARPVTNLRLNLEYFNTASLLWLAKILRVLVQINGPDYVLIIHLYLQLEDYDEIEDFDDIKDAFIPIAGIINSTIPSVGIRLYGIDDNDLIVKDTLVFIELETAQN